MPTHNIFQFKFDEMYKLYVAKAERKGRTSDEVNQIICYLTGYTFQQLQKKITQSVTMEEFFNSAPLPNPNRFLIKGSICGVKIDEITDPLMKEIRYLDKMIDELAKGKTIDKILR